MSIYHIVTEEEWKKNQEKGFYAGESLSKDGFIHCCSKDQIQQVRDQWFKERQDLLLIEMDESRLNAEIKYESPENVLEKFPHVYGLINLTAVIRVTKL